MSSANPRNKKREFGQVFTQDPLVANIINRPELKEYLIDISRTVLEPAVGEGAFLRQILHQRLDSVVTQALQQPTREAQLAYYESYSLVALSTLYGIELQQDVVEICRANLAKVMRDHYQWFIAQHIVQLDMSHVPAHRESEQKMQDLVEHLQECIRKSSHQRTQHVTSNSKTYFVKQLEQLVPACSLQGNFYALPQTKQHGTSEQQKSPAQATAHTPTSQTRKCHPSPLQRIINSIKDDGEEASREKPQPRHNPSNTQIHDVSEQTKSEPSESAPGEKVAETPTTPNPIPAPAHSFQGRAAWMLPWSNPWYVHALLEFYYILSNHGKLLHALCVYPAPTPTASNQPQTTTHTSYPACQTANLKKQAAQPCYQQLIMQNVWGDRLRGLEKIYILEPKVDARKIKDDGTLAPVHLQDFTIMSLVTTPVSLARVTSHTQLEPIAFAAPRLSQLVLKQAPTILRSTDEQVVATQVAAWADLCTQACAAYPEITTSTPQASTELNWEFTLAGVAHVEETNSNRSATSTPAPSAPYLLRLELTAPLRSTLQQAIDAIQEQRKNYKDSRTQYDPKYLEKEKKELRDEIATLKGWQKIVDDNEDQQKIIDVAKKFSKWCKFPPLRAELVTKYELTYELNEKTEQALLQTDTPQSTSTIAPSAITDDLCLLTQLPWSHDERNATHKFINQLRNGELKADQLFSPFASWNHIFQPRDKLPLTQLLSWAQHRQGLIHWCKDEPLVANYSKRIKFLELPTAWVARWDEELTPVHNPNASTWLEMLANCCAPQAILERRTPATTDASNSELWLEIRSVAEQLVDVDLGILESLIPVASIYHPLTHTTLLRQHLQQLLRSWGMQLSQLMLRASRALDLSVEQSAYFQYLVTEWEYHFTHLVELTCRYDHQQLPQLGELFQSAGLGGCLAQLEEWGVAYTLRHEQLANLARVVQQLTPSQLQAVLHRQAQLLCLGEYTVQCMLQLLGQHAPLWLSDAALQTQFAHAPHLADSTRTGLVDHMHSTAHPAVFKVWQNWSDSQPSSQARSYLAFAPHNSQPQTTTTLRSANHAAATNLGIVKSELVASTSWNTEPSTHTPSTRQRAQAQAARDLEALVQLVQTAQPSPSTLSSTTDIPQGMRCNAEADEAIGVVAPASKPRTRKKKEAAPVTESIPVTATAANPTPAKRKRRKAPEPIDILDHNAPPAPKSSFKFIHVPELVQYKRKSKRAKNSQETTEAPELTAQDFKGYQRILHSESLYKRTKALAEVETIKTYSSPARRKTRARAETPAGYDPDEYEAAKKLLLKRFYSSNGRLRKFEENPDMTTDSNVTLSSSEGSTPKTKRSPRRPLSTNKRLQAAHPQAKLIKLGSSRSGATASRTTHPALSTRGTKEQESSSLAGQSALASVSNPLFSRPTPRGVTGAKRGNKLITPHLLFPLAIHAHETQTPAHTHLESTPLTTWQLNKSDNTLQILAPLGKELTASQSKKTSNKTSKRHTPSSASLGLLEQALEQAQLLEQYSSGIKKLKVPAQRGRPRGSTKPKLNVAPPQLTLSEAQEQLESYLAQHLRGRRPRHIEQALEELRKQQQQGNLTEGIPELQELPQSYLQRCTPYVNQYYIASTQEIIQANIIHGDFLTGKRVTKQHAVAAHRNSEAAKDEAEIIFVEWQISDYQCLPLKVQRIDHSYFSILNQRKKLKEYQDDRPEMREQPLLNRAALYGNGELLDTPTTKTAHSLLTPLRDSEQAKRHLRAQLSQWLVTYNLCLELAVEPEITWERIPELISRLALLSPVERQARYTALRAQRDAQEEVQAAARPAEFTNTLTGEINPLTLSAAQLEAWEAQQRGRWEQFLTQLAAQTPTAVVAYDCQNRACELLNNRVPHANFKLLDTNDKGIEEIDWEYLLDTNQYLRSNITKQDVVPQVRKIEFSKYLEFVREAEDIRKQPRPELGYLSLVTQEVVLNNLRQLRQQMLRSGLSVWQQLQVNLAELRAQLKSIKTHNSSQNVEFISPYLPKPLSLSQLEEASCEQMLEMKTEELQRVTIINDQSTHYPRLSFLVNPTCSTRLVASELLHHAWVWNNTQVAGVPEYHVAPTALPVAQGEHMGLNSWDVSVIMLPEIQLSNDIQNQQLGQWYPHPVSTTPVVQHQSRAHLHHTQLAPLFTQYAPRATSNAAQSSDSHTLSYNLWDAQQWADAPTYQRFYGGLGVSYDDYLAQQQALSEPQEQKLQEQTGTRLKFTDRISDIEARETTGSRRMAKHKWKYITHLIPQHVD